MVRTSGFHNDAFGTQHLSRLSATHKGVQDSESGLECVHIAERDAFREAPFDLCMIFCVPKPPNLQLPNPNSAETLGESSHMHGGHGAAQNDDESLWKANAWTRING